MSWDIQDRWLWLGFGVVLFLTSRGISHALQNTIDLSDIHDLDRAKATNEIQAEDSISLASLKTLATSPNMELANSAINLLLTRFASSEYASASLTKDLLSPNPTSRQQAKQVLTLFDQNTWDTSLEILPLREEVARKLYDTSGPATQMMCRAFFRAMRHYRTGRLNLLSSIATTVEDSTKVSGSSSSSSRNSSSHRIAFGDDGVPLPFRFNPASQPVASLVDMISEQAAGLQPRMNRARVRIRSSGSSDTDSVPEMEDTTGAYVPLLEPLTSVVGAGDDTVGFRTRLHDESFEETELRRRRREAMVLHEGGGSIGREDIIHPRTGNP